MRSQVHAHCCLVMCVAASHNRMQSAIFSLARAFAALSSLAGDFGLAGTAAGGDAPGGDVAACASTPPALSTSDRNAMTMMRMILPRTPNGPWMAISPLPRPHYDSGPYSTSTPAEVSVRSACPHLLQHPPSGDTHL